MLYQLSYSSDVDGIVFMGLGGWGLAKRVEGIEPSSLAWKAIALPLSYTRGQGFRQAPRLFLCVFCCALVVRAALFELCVRVVRLAPIMAPKWASCSAENVCDQQLTRACGSWVSGECRIRTCEGNAIRFTV